MLHAPVVLVVLSVGEGLIAPGFGLPRVLKSVPLFWGCAGVRSALRACVRAFPSVSQATVPLQKFFGQRTSKKMRKFEEARTLPGPLYALFAQLEALEDDHGALVGGWGKGVVLQPCVGGWVVGQPERMCVCGGGGRARRSDLSLPCARAESELRVTIRNNTSSALPPAAVVFHGGGASSSGGGGASSKRGAGPLHFVVPVSGFLHVQRGCARECL